LEVVKCGEKRIPVFHKLVKCGENVIGLSKSSDDLTHRIFVVGEEVREISMFEFPNETVVDAEAHDDEHIKLIFSTPEGEYFGKAVVRLYPDIAE